MSGFNANSKLRGGVSSVGAVGFFYGKPTKFEDENGTIWLKSGFLEDDIASYPDAPIILINNLAGSPTLEFDYSSIVTSEQEGAYDPIEQFVYILDISSNVHKFQKDGTHVSSFNQVLGDSGAASFTSICAYDGKIYLSTTNAIHIFDSSGTYVELSDVHFGTQTIQSNIATDGNSIFCTCKSGASQSFYVATQTGAEVLNYYTNSTSYRVYGMSYYQGYLYFYERNNSANTYYIYRWSPNNDDPYKTRVSAYSNSPNNPNSLLIVDNTFWIHDSTNNKFDSIPTHQYVGTPESFPMNDNRSEPCAYMVIGKK